MRQRLGTDIAIAAKIESVGGLKNAYGIISEADAVMVARGDLLVELSYDGIDLIKAEKCLMDQCDLLQKSCIIATRVADSLEEQDSMTAEEITLLHHELAAYKAPLFIMLANETTVDESRCVRNIGIINEAAAFAAFHDYYR